MGGRKSRRETNEMVGKFEAADIGGCVFEVDDDKLFVFVGGKEERRFAAGFDTEKVAVLGLVGISRETSKRVQICFLHHYGQRPTAPSDDLAHRTVSLTIFGTSQQYSERPPTQLHKPSLVSSTFPFEMLEDALCQRRFDDQPS